MSTIYKKPRIGITTWRRDLPTFLGEKTDLYTLGEEYVRCVIEAGGLPILLPHGPADNIMAYLDLLDGLIVSGGGDIDPLSYGEQDQGKSYDVRRSADYFEINLVQEASKRAMPTMGICRGFQLLQAAFGGKLAQDLHAIYPEHPKNEGDAAYILGQKHRVDLEEDSILAEIYGSTQRQVNTIHHQCVTKAGDGFKEIGWSEDGMIEAVQSQSDWFAFGMQWHPEKMEDPTEQKVFDYFIRYVGDQVLRGDRGGDKSYFRNGC
ncbi:gamma-glutamyl-gamma-aminobutyrate hydrolase family protein [Brevibacillus daliensis]|uniref:gamma-glutamyl-gamma-aminobutyrate hydrolase family protein n=1 Tax=Brevibacillus daliensis TaxID=2892995 RepID=UPI001E44FA46|nr:gamma-glutamyl-gamma-aminobutyrate hydrolase family protein [Brevibacillus daliensis]